MHLQSGEQATCALAHLQFEHSPLQTHLLSSMQALQTSRIVIDTCSHVSPFLAQAKSWGEGICGRDCAHVVHTPAW